MRATNSHFILHIRVPAIRCGWLYQTSGPRIEWDLCNLGISKSNEWGRLKKAIAIKNEWGDSKKTSVPGLMYRFFRAHSSRIDRYFLNGAPETIVDTRFDALNKLLSKIKLSSSSFMCETSLNSNAEKKEELNNESDLPTQPLPSLSPAWTCLQQEYSFRNKGFPREWGSGATMI